MNLRRIKWLLVFSTFWVSPWASANETAIELEKISSAKVTYVNYRDLSAHPTPVLSLKRSGLATGPAEIIEIKEKLIYPLINQSEEPISSIVVEFFPKLRNVIGIEVYWSNGTVRSSLIERGAKGQYNAQAYRIFFQKPTE